MGLQFTDPPPQNRASVARAKGTHLMYAEIMRERPGEWAVIHTAPNANAAASYARHIRLGVMAAYAPARSFEACARTVDGEHLVYARYVGEGVEE